MVEKKCANGNILRMSEDKILEFISLYAKEECLWKTDSEFYTNKTARSIATKNIADAINLPDFEAKHVMIKIRNLRNSYSQELNKIAASIELGREHRPRLIWFNLMDSFLRNYLKKPKFDDAIQQKINEQLDECVSNNNVCKHVNHNVNYNVNNNVNDTVIYSVNNNANNIVTYNINNNVTYNVNNNGNNNVNSYVINDPNINVTNVMNSDVTNVLNSNLSDVMNIDVTNLMNNNITNVMNSDVTNQINSNVTSVMNSDVTNLINSNVTNVMNSDLTDIMDSNLTNNVSNVMNNNASNIINNNIPVVVVNPVVIEDEEWCVIGDPEPIEEMYSEDDLSAIPTSDLVMDPLEPINKRPREEDCIDPLLLNKEYFDEFGQTISTLLRALPLKKAMALQPQILNMINSAALEMD